MHPLTQMKLLVNLAQIDGEVATRERNYIINIGRANGIYPDEINPLFEQKHEVIIPDGMSADQKFEYIHNLVQLMKIDKRMYQEEIRFCSAIANKLGYEQEVMIELMLNVKVAATNGEELKALRELTD